MHHSRTLLALCVLALLLDSTGQAKAAKLALTTIEGVVTATREIEGEGDLPTLAVVLELSGGDEHRTVLLAPSASCAEIGFEVEEGDRLRARIFVGGDGPAKAHKALNLTRGTIVRFRTLRSIPLWTTTGVWQGAPGRKQPSAGRAQSGRSPPRRGQGGPG